MSAAVLALRFTVPLGHGQPFRILTLVDQYIPLCVALAAGRSMSGTKVVEALNRTSRECAGKPESIACDNCSGFAGQDVATLILGTGLRPNEAFKLRWEHVLLNGRGGLIQVAGGRSKAARRMLAMAPAVYAVLRACHEAQGCPSEG